MILIGLGANLVSKQFGAPSDTLEAALLALEKNGVTIVARSRWYKSAPVPVSDQPWFVNGGIAVATQHSPEPLLDVLLEIEHEFGRERGVANAARVLDLDLLAYGSQTSVPGGRLDLPHPRLENRAFVLLPLAEIAPNWCHPVTKQGIGSLISALDLDKDGAQMAEPCD